MAVWSVVPFSEVAAVERWDAEFYRPIYLEQEDAATDRAEPLETIASVSDGNHLAISSQFGEGPVPYLRGGDLSDFFLRDIEPERIPVDAYTSLRRSHMKPGDVLLSIVGTVGMTALVTDEYPQLTGSCKIAIVRPRAIRSGYLAAYLASSLGQHLIERRIRGAVQQGLILPDLKALPAPRLSDEREAEIDALVYDAHATSQRSSSRYADAEALLADALGLGGLALPTPKTYTAMFSDTAAAERLDAGYFHPEKRAMLAHLGRDGARPLSAYVRSVRKMVTPSKRDPDAAVRNFDLPDALRFHLSDDVLATTFGELGSTKKAMQPGDVAVSRLRFYLKEVAVVRTASGLPVVGSSEFYVLRPVPGAGLRAEAVVVLLRSDAVQSILKWCQNGSAHPRFDERDLLSIPIPPALLDVQDEIADLLSQSIELERESARQLAQATARVEALVLEA